ncbi:uncharacterized protein I303_105514 [Kwoniella dejecticola CBS 10117]|uniref:Uncharacterized protein n=1 Tax=Kwoniella dejecticola CBS 10117 TaxID=1296121 RepID=A0A1A6A2A4_9TREE|nr:uncharacterized protein I303_05043 [Kwoniella dejecticola CBS 10117]OBR84186.1 hypothetical protein I303_05043 [Kwoniella dejecticola CBS 10117]
MSGSYDMGDNNMTMTQLCSCFDTERYQGLLGFLRETFDLFVFCMTKIFDYLTVILEPKTTLQLFIACVVCFIIIGYPTASCVRKIKPDLARKIDTTCDQLCLVPMLFFLGSIPISIYMALFTNARLIDSLKIPNYPLIMWMMAFLATVMLKHFDPLDRPKEIIYMVDGVCIKYADSDGFWSYLIEINKREAMRSEKIFHEEWDRYIN